VIEPLYASGAYEPNEQKKREPFLTLFVVDKKIEISNLELIKDIVKLTYLEEVLIKSKGSARSS
jgi:hypothetical protein